MKKVLKFMKGETKIKQKNKYSLIFLSLLYCLHGVNTAQTHAISSYEGRSLETKKTEYGVVDFKCCLFESAADKSLKSDYTDGTYLKFVEGYFTIELVYSGFQAENEVFKKF